MTDANSGLGDLFDQLGQLQQQLADAQSVAVEGTAGGGAVRITASGELSFDAVAIDPRVVDPAGVGLLEDLVLAALHDLAAKLADARQQALGSVLGSALGGLFGADTDESGEDDGGEIPPELSS